MQLIEEAEQYIRSELARGPRLVGDLEQGTSINKRTLQRAAKRLAIKRSRQGKGGPVVWSLDPLDRLFH